MRLPDEELECVRRVHVFTRTSWSKANGGSNSLSNCVRQARATHGCASVHMHEAKPRAARMLAQRCICSAKLQRLYS